MVDLHEVQRRFAAFAETTRSRAPLYSRLSAAVSSSPEVASLLMAAPEGQRTPVLLFAAVHDLVLRGHATDLAAHYPNVTEVPAPGDPWPAFRAACVEQTTTLTDLIANRHTQTNEVGRCALFLPLFSLLADETLAPIAQVDIGTSAGLNLLWPRFGYDYEPGPALGDSPVRLPCAVRGEFPWPVGIPPAAPGVGLDAQPVDVTSDDAVRWLEACVWPDQRDRFDRLTRAVAVARRHPPDVRRGDAVTDVAGLVRAASGRGHAVVTTSWVLNYLSHDQRVAFVAELDEVGASIDFSWVIAEAPAQTSGLPVPTRPQAEHLTVLSLVTWRGGARTVQRMATDHPHGYWVHWGA